jgi:hypothetical protein
MKNLSTAYDYRSRVAHGKFVFDDVRMRRSADRVGIKGKRGNPFHDVNEVLRLTAVVSSYYQRLLVLVIDREELAIDWSSQGL